MFADHTRSPTPRAHQPRLYCSSFACVGLTGTAHAKARSTTIPAKLIKSGARIRSTARKVWLSFSKTRPRASDIAESLANLEHHLSSPHIHLLQLQRQALSVAAGRFAEGVRQRLTAFE